jgi:hypothetical protein
LQYHLRYMAHIEKRPVSQEDRQEVIKDKFLREQIAEILDNSETEESELQRLLRSNDIRNLILRLDKQRRTREGDAKRYKAQKGKPATLTAVSLVPGGAPGLGKR